ncbi:hypothetical protein ACHAXS_000322 [Conticribra weissflogii]
MARLHVLSLAIPFQALSHNTNISISEHCKFFYTFITKMHSVRDNYIYLPKNQQELDEIMDRYKDMRLPGCGGSIDVVHVKWSQCPAGDANRCKGKESYPSMAWCDNTRKIIGISSVQFGTRNDKHIVKIDENVAKIRDGWFSQVQWEYNDMHDNVMTETGVYLICNGGYLHWPVLMCPYKHASVASREGYFSTNVEGARKDVECTFGILKKRWRILDYGICFCDIKVGNKFFVTCYILHNMMLSEVQEDRVTPPVSCGIPTDGSGKWLEAASDVPAAVMGNERWLAAHWAKRRGALVDHRHYVHRAKRLRHC